MEIKGKVLQVLPVESGISKSGNEWQKASLIVEVAENPQYPKKVKISNMKNAEAFAAIAVGAKVVFKVEIESREYNSRWYTEVSCWGWTLNTQSQSPTPTTAQQGWEAAYPQPSPQPPYAQPAPPAPPAQGDDLPF